MFFLFLFVFVGEEEKKHEVEGGACLISWAFTLVLFSSVVFFVRFASTSVTRVIVAQHVRARSTDGKEGAAKEGRPRRAGDHF